MLNAITLLALAGARVAEAPKTWAVVVAGSNTYMNYRHQADVCHAYQILSKQGGIPDEQIVVMMADDIAHDEENPTPGKLINIPNGTDVYQGVPKDYTGRDVNKNTFLNVLKGIKTRNTSKVLESTSEDEVFIYYADHGATGFVMMPFGDPLYADELMDAINYMHQNKMYKKLVIYMEACESGSMFVNYTQNLTDVNAYAVTAATDKESSYACFWDESRHTFLADEWSVSWLKDSDARMLWRETLEAQFQYAKNETGKSTSMRYGDMSFVNDAVKDFQGQKGNHSHPHIRPRWHSACFPSSDSRDVRLDSLKQRLQHSVEEAAREKLRADIEAEEIRRQDIEHYFRVIVKKATSHSPNNSSLPKTFEEWVALHASPTDWEGMRMLYRLFEQACFGFDEFSLKYWTVLVSLNELLTTGAVWAAINDACSTR